MSRFDPAAGAGRLARSLRAADVTGRAGRAVRSLKAEYEAGKRGDDAPVQPIWASPAEQLDAVVGLLRAAGGRTARLAPPVDDGYVAAADAGAGSAAHAGAPGDGDTEPGDAGMTDAVTDAATGDPTPGATAADAAAADGVDVSASGPVDAGVDDAAADEVASALRAVDWGQVRAATAARSTDAARTVRTMAEQVDWARVQPVAAQVSTALIAAVASGQLGMGGRLGSVVARAIVDQGGLAQQVARRVDARHLVVPDELRRAIDTTAREVDPRG